MRNLVRDATRKSLQSGREADHWTQSIRRRVPRLGCFFAMYALAIELPFSTAIMLRSIAGIARQEGENLDDIDARLACVSVFGPWLSQQGR